MLQWRHESQSYVIYVARLREVYHSGTCFHSLKRGKMRSTLRSAIQGFSQDNHQAPEHTGLETFLIKLGACIPGF